MTAPILGIIGGTGLQDLEGLRGVRTISVDTPYGSPSSPILIGELEGHEIAFLARHGLGHHLIPSEVNYRANIYALKTLAIEKILAVSASGSLREDYAPGEMVIPDQLFDNTKDRPRSFFGEGLVAHISSADPFCPVLREQLIESVAQAGGVGHEGGAYLAVEGPRFSTRAESNVFRSWGMSIIGMTLCPEAFLAREAEMCYAALSHVTDYDVWHSEEEPVTVERVFQTLKQNAQLAQETIRKLVPQLLPTPGCACQSALQDALITNIQNVPAEVRKRLTPLIGKYLDEPPQD